MAIKIGDRWAAVECIADAPAPRERTALDADGNPYVVEARMVRQLRFRCGCGKEFGVWWREFRGKRLVRDCGCGKAGVAREALIMSWSTDRGVKEKVEREARRQVQTASWVVNTALREYFERVESGAVTAVVMGLGEGEADNVDSGSAWDRPLEG